MHTAGLHIHHAETHSRIFPSDANYCESVGLGMDAVGFDLDHVTSIGRIISRVVDTEPDPDMDSHVTRAGLALKYSPKVGELGMLAFSRIEFGCDVRVVLGLTTIVCPHQQAIIDSITDRIGELLAEYGDRMGIPHAFQGLKVQHQGEFARDMATQGRPLPAGSLIYHQGWITPAGREKFIGIYDKLSRIPAAQRSEHQNQVLNMAGDNIEIWNELRRRQGDLLTIQNPFERDMQAREIANNTHASRIEQRRQRANAAAGNAGHSGGYDEDTSIIPILPVAA